MAGDVRVHAGGVLDALFDVADALAGDRLCDGAIHASSRPVVRHAVELVDRRLHRRGYFGGVDGAVQSEQRLIDSGALVRVQQICIGSEPFGRRRLCRGCLLRLRWLR